MQTITLETLKNKTYLVGGAVRDKLLGIESKDNDFVVINSNEQEMLSLGFEKVGQDFPVFLHPITKDEYALARIEKKTSGGYSGFSFETDNVSLQDDLYRRDLTINAMAFDLINNQLIDPFGGQADLKNKTLKHVSNHFSEDPVRILRTGRFSARYNFSIHPTTHTLLKTMVENKEADHLVQERITKEFTKAIQEPFLINFFNTLESVGLLQKLGNFSTIMNNPQTLSKIRVQFINHPNIEQNILNYIFQDFSNKELKNFKLESNQVDNIELFKKWQTKLPYEALTNIEKIQFIKETKAIHNETTAIYTNELSSFLLNTTTSSQQIKTDINNIKNIDYETLVNSNLDKKNIKQLIETAQLEAILEKTTKTHKLR